VAVEDVAEVVEVVEVAEVVEVMEVAASQKGVASTLETLHIKQWDLDVQGGTVIVDLRKEIRTNVVNNCTVGRIEYHLIVCNN
jgi:alkyl hydroperoxide reductase subunit AhpC